MDREKAITFLLCENIAALTGSQWFQAVSRGCLKSWLLFRHPREFKIKSLYSNDLILNIASKSKETVQKLKFLDSPLLLISTTAIRGGYETRTDVFTLWPCLDKSL